MAGKRGFSKYVDRRSSSTFKIQITSMVDMFVILLVFLLLFVANQLGDSGNLVFPRLR